MSSLTLKGIPDEVMERLRNLAEKERRSLNQQAILLLERALDQNRPSFTEAYEVFLRRHGPSPLTDAEVDAVFEGVRDPGTGRPSPFEEGEAHG